MSDSVGDFVWQRLGDWDVKHNFGFPGDSINGLVGAFDRAKDEGLAAFMAAVMPSTPAISGPVWRPRDRARSSF